jgi:hypothetical protein
LSNPHVPGTGDTAGRLSRPYDSNDTLRSDEDPDYIRWNSFPLYKLEGFSHPLFLSFVDKMRVAQDMAANREMVVPGAIRNEVKRVVTEKVRHPLEQMLATQNSILLLFMELQQRIAAVPSNRAFAPSNVTPVAPSVAAGVAFESQLPQAPVLYTKKGAPRKKAPKTDILGDMPNGALWSKQLKKAKASTGRSFSMG